MSKQTTQRVRRTKAQIEADKLAEQARIQKLAEEKLARLPVPKPDPWKCTVRFLVEGYTACGAVREKGEILTIVEGTPEYKLSFDAYNNFIFNKTPEQQMEQWGEVRYIADLS